MNSRKDIDMIQGSMRRSILLFALPLSATGILQQLINAADIAVVGRCIGKNAMAAVGANSPIINLIVNLFVGISLGTNVVIATSIGRKDSRTIQKAVHTSILFAIMGGLPVAVFGELFARSLLEYLGVPAEILPMAIRYLRVYLGGMPIILLYNFEAAIFRGSGNTKTPLAALTISGVINVILNLFFVLVIGMTVEGVALATVIANLISAAILFYKLWNCDSDIHIQRDRFRIDWNVLGKILKIGIPAGIQSGIFSLANIVIQTAINSLGATIMAGSSAAYNLEILVYYVLNSFGQTCTTFVGQNYGAGNAKRCKQALVICLLMDITVTACLVAIILLTGHQLLSVFNPEQAVIDAGYVRLQYIFLSYVFTLPHVVLSGYLCGFGISLPPALISVFGVCVTRLLWIFIAFPHNRTFATIMTAYPLSMLITAISVALALLILHPARNLQRTVRGIGQEHTALRKGNEI
ncbi:MAG: MATE family efflux transporter [Lachnospiraceae bacterium]|nr:MATE family efflux transporter [Lachnospiraceae bacterium]